MATFRKRSNSWQARVQRKDYPDVSKSFKTYSEAVAWARKIEFELDSGLVTATPKQSPSVTLKELLERYRKEVTCRKKHSSVESYRITSWIKHPLSSKPISSIKSADIAKWRDERLELGRSANTIRLELAILSNLYTVAENEWGYEGLSNPVFKVSLPKLPSGRIRRLNPDELDLLINNTESPYLKSIVTLALETGMRRSEIAFIKWKHISLVKRTLLIPVTKNGEAREVPLSPTAINLLKSLQNNTDDKVFNTTPHAITIAFGRACKRAKLDNLHFHDLRHEAISRFFEKGLSLAEVATISGHKTWTMLRRYTHLSAANIAMKLG